jgi:tryptophan synthase alpha chain
MTHMVASYPDYESSFQVSKGLSELGASYIEVQFPFSDPTADGPLIQEACERSLKQGFTLSQGFALVRRITEELQLPVFIMSYAAPVVVCGIHRYLKMVKASGAVGVIIPDLAVGNDDGLFERAHQLGLSAVPVTAPNISDERMQAVASVKPAYVYAALRAGITGQNTRLTDEVKTFLGKLRITEARILGGFGIKTRQQTEELAPYVHAAVVGSHLLEVLNRALGTGEDIVEALSKGFE